jgi:hypothetical protein
MIHPEYIKAFFDTYAACFRVNQFKDKYLFDICFYSDNIQLLYKIKARFKSGKIITLFHKKYILKINKQLDPIIIFLNKNRPYNTPAQIQFLRWAYLYRKLIIEKDIVKSDKELRRIRRRLEYFKIAR